MYWVKVCSTEITTWTSLGEKKTIPLYEWDGPIGSLDAAIEYAKDLGDTEIQYFNV